MKWARVKDGSGSATQDQLASYVFYANQDELRKKFGITKQGGGKDNLWVRYDLTQCFAPKSERDYEKNKRDYEIFVGGFLQFYDLEVRNGATNHQLYFDWAPFKKGGPFYVAIYLFPRPLKVKDRKAAWDKQRAEQEAQWGAAKKTAEAADANAAVSERVGDSFESIDPPKPPPPPPPPRD